MGLFSYLTSDREKSIPAFSDGEWWLVSPMGKTKVTHYDGYGRFSTPEGEEIEIHGWLARLNFPKIEMEDEAARMVGICLRHGRYYTDNLLNKYGCKMHLRDLIQVLGQDEVHLFDDYEAQFEVLGIKSSANEHIKEGRLKEVGIQSEVKLKIVSEESNANFDALEEVRNCPHQGYFYEGIFA